MFSQVVMTRGMPMFIPMSSGRGGGGVPPVYVAIPLGIMIVALGLILMLMGWDMWRSAWDRSWVDGVAYSMFGIMGLAVVGFGVALIYVALC